MVIRKQAQRSRRQRVILRTREEILSAAARAFAREEHPTMDDIAKEAGFSAPSLYTYFKSKEEICDAVLQQIRQDMLKTFEEPVPQGLRPAARIELLLRRHLSVVDAHSDAYRMLVRVSNDCQSVRKREKSKAGFVAQFAKAFVGWAEAAGLSDEFGGCSAEDAGYAYWGILHGFLLRWLNRSPQAALLDDAQIIVNFMVYGMSGRSKAPRRTAQAADAEGAAGPPVKSVPRRSRTAVLGRSSP